MGCSELTFYSTFEDEPQDSLSCLVVGKGRDGRDMTDREEDVTVLHVGKEVGKGSAQLEAAISAATAKICSAAPCFTCEC